MQKTSKKGFTLVEIMIVVVIIGLLAAMAIPAFNKVRTNSRISAMDNDARQIGSAIQQYMLENGVPSVSLGYDSTSGSINNTLSAYVKKIGKNYTITASGVTQDGVFSIQHPQAGSSARSYNAEGQYNN